MGDLNKTSIRNCQANLRDQWLIPCEIVLTGMPLDLSDDESTLVHEMAWCN